MVSIPGNSYRIIYQIYMIHIYIPCEYPDRERFRFAGFTSKNFNR
jgi:hypothetical protein